MNERNEQTIFSFVRRAQTTEDRAQYREIVRLAGLRWYAAAEERLRWMERDLMQRAAMAAECRAALLELKTMEHRK